MGRHTTIHTLNIFYTGDNPSEPLTIPKSFRNEMDKKYGYPFDLSIDEDNQIVYVDSCTGSCKTKYRNIKEVFPTIEIITKWILEINTATTFCGTKPIPQESAELRTASTKLFPGAFTGSLVFTTETGGGSYSGIVYVSETEAILVTYDTDHLYTENNIGLAVKKEIIRI